MRGQNFNENASGLQGLRVDPGTDLQVVVDRTNIDQLERIKRETTANPRVKQDTYQRIPLSKNKSIYTVECKSSTLIGCFSAIRSGFHTTKCLIKDPVVLSGRVYAQGCECAS